MYLFIAFICDEFLIVFLSPTIIVGRHFNNLVPNSLPSPLLKLIYLPLTLLFLTISLEIYPLSNGQV